MLASREDIEKVTWQRETSPFGVSLARSITRTLLEGDSGENALDLACGDGLLTKELCRHFNRVVGVDASSHHIDVARMRVPEAEFRVSLIEDFDPAGELFDRIYMISILEHLDDPVATLRVVQKWLNENGSILLCVPNALSLNRRIGHRMGLLRTHYELTDKDGDVGHKRFYDLGKLVEDATRSGLSVTASGGTLLKPFSNDQMEWFLSEWGKFEEADWGRRLLQALCDMGQSLPEYANAVWVRCIVDKTWGVRRDD